jgi:hypothetical protein
MSGGKGGSTTSEVKIPEYIEAAAQRNLNRADRVSQIGYVPEYGPSVAAFTPMQQAAFQNTANAADAFGMSSTTSQRDTMGGMDAPTTYANGVKGYSSAPMYEGMLAEFQAKSPGQYKAITDMFINPETGAAPAYSFGTNPAQANAPAVTNPSAPYNTTGGYGEGSNQDYSKSSNGFTDPIFGLPAGIGGIEKGNSSTSNGFSNSMFGLPSGFGGIETGNTSDGLGGGGGGGGGGGCVVATHAVESGAFSPHMKREAVVWCMDVLHGKWWGEAIRRGYRHCANKKIEQGKAREHYDEFRRYIDFARGKKRTLRGAATFTLRTVQFFAIGLVKRDA